MICQERCKRTAASVGDTINRILCDGLSRFVDVPEWLLGMTRNHVGFARVGSNPTVHAFSFSFLFGAFCPSDLAFICMMTSLSLDLHLYDEKPTQHPIWRALRCRITQSNYCNWQLHSPIY